MDIMLGNWASANLAKLDSPKLAQFEAVLKLENPDLFKWLTGQAPVPPEVRRMLARARRERTA
jgi:antitoxin CptB